MKKVLTISCVLILLIVVIFIFAISQNQKLTQTIFKPIIAQQCKNELTNSKYWQSMRLIISSERQIHVQQHICSCVSEHALKDISAKNLLLASLDEAKKNRLTHQAILNSMQACTQTTLNAFLN